MGRAGLRGGSRGVGGSRPVRLRCGRGGCVVVRRCSGCISCGSLSRGARSDGRRERLLLRGRRSRVRDLWLGWGGAGRGCRCGGRLLLTFCWGGCRRDWGLACRDEFGSREIAVTLPMETLSRADPK